MEYDYYVISLSLKNLQRYLISHDQNVDLIKTIRTYQGWGLTRLWSNGHWSIMGLSKHIQLKGLNHSLNRNEHPHKNYIKLQLEPEMNVKFPSPYDATVRLMLASLERNFLPDWGSERSRSGIIRVKNTRYRSSSGPS